MMTIQDAAKSWRVSEKTILNYILKGYIYNLSIENNEIVFPDIPKPYVVKKPKTVAEYDKYILTAMNKELYVNAKIMGIDQGKFESRLVALVKAGKIFQAESYVGLAYLSTLGFVLAVTDEKRIDLTIAPTLEVKIADQVGVVNGRVF